MEQQKNKSTLSTTVSGNGPSFRGTPLGKVRSLRFTGQFFGSKPGSGALKRPWKIPMTNRMSSLWTFTKSSPLQTYNKFIEDETWNTRIWRDIIHKSWNFIHLSPVKSGELPIFLIRTRFNGQVEVVLLNHSTYAKEIFNIMHKSPDLQTWPYHTKGYARNEKLLGTSFIYLSSFWLYENPVKKSSH